jgi:hypothetical protein
MKIKFQFLVSAFSVLALIGCANNQQSASSTNTNPSANTYTNDDLQRTGKRQAGEALKAADPSVTTTTGR